MVLDLELSKNALAALPQFVVTEGGIGGYIGPDMFRQGYRACCSMVRQLSSRKKEDSSRKKDSRGAQPPTFSRSCFA